jgi:hypothetical protein
MLPPVRWALFLTLAACSFETNIVTDGMPPDMNGEMPPVVAWSVDATSGKAVHASTKEWTDFITAKQLNIFPPNGLWLMQDANGNLVDDVGNVDLAIQSGAPMYRGAITGWSRLAVKMGDGEGVRFANTTDSSLPSVSSSSLTVLMLYANETTPAATRTVLVGGSGPASVIAEVGIDNLRHFRLSVNGTPAFGTMDHGAGVLPLVLKLDRTNMQQKLVTNKETITPPYTALSGGRGIFIGAANAASPEGRWLYMAAWYGPAAEINDSDITKLLTALGW